MAEAIFGISLAVVLYVYFGYPLLLMVWRRLGRRPVRRQYGEPLVTIVIAMHNEARGAVARLANLFELDYPRDRMQVIVSLDAPTDGTPELIRNFNGGPVRLIESDERIGKAEAVNRAMKIADGDIVVFADARQRFDPKALRELTANFADPAVGGVSGELVLLDDDGTEAGGVGWYWRYEKQLRTMESEIHSVAGATGAIYAIRRELFTPLSPGTILDDVVTPLRIVLAGKRVILDPAARAYDRVEADPEVEFERKRRTLAGNYQLLQEGPALLWRNPIRIQFLSHKVGRLVVPYFLVALLLSNAFLQSGIYRVLFACQILWYAAALVGWILAKRSAAAPAPVGAVQE